MTPSDSATALRNGPKRKWRVSAPGFDRVRVAGDPETEKETLARARGITLHDGVWQGLAEAAGQTGVPVPE